MVNRAEIWEEINLASQFKEQGQHGKARVLSRRAVGKACEMLLRTAHAWDPGMSALDAIEYVSSSTISQPEWDPLLPHFLMHVNQEHNLPETIDLVSEAKELVLGILSVIDEKEQSHGRN